MEIQYVEVALGLAGLVVANYGVKLGRAYPLLKKAMKFARDQAEAKKDGVLTEKEKSVLYDDIELLVREAYSILKGFFPNKSK